MRRKDQMSLRLPTFLTIYTILYVFTYVPIFTIEILTRSYGVLSIGVILLNSLVAFTSFVIMGYITLKLRKINTYFSIASIMVLLEALTITLMIILSVINLYTDITNITINVVTSLHASFFLMGCISLAQNYNYDIDYSKAMKFSIGYTIISLVIGVLLAMPNFNDIIPALIGLACEILFTIILARYSRLIRQAENGK